MKKDVNAVTLGKRGGASTLKNRGLKYFSDIGKEGAKKRWKYHKKKNNL